MIDTSIDDRGFQKGLKSISGQAEGLTATFKKLGNAVAAAFAISKIVQFGREAVELGSNVAEVQNVVDVAFGEVAYKVEAFADTAIESFGMSQLAAKKTASTYMAMAKNMGISMDAASDMAITLAGLTGDVASFYNISQELADIKLKSVFTGETETLKDLGIVMTQANLEAYALANGIDKSLSAMSQAELVTLRYNFVLEQLSDASGDFIRTQDSWANQTRILSMQWQEFMSIIGQALIQVLRPVLSTLNSVVSSLISMANALNTALTSIFGGAQTEIQQTQNEVGGVAGGIDQAVDNQNALTDATKQTNKEQKKTLAGFDEINKLSGSSTGGSANSAGGTAGVLVGTPAPIPQTYTVDVKLSDQSSAILSFFNNLKAAIEPTTQAIGRLWEELKRVGSFAGDALTSFYNNFLVPVGTWVMGEGLPRFIDAISNGLALIDFQVINNSLTNLWNALAPFVNNVGEGLLWFWENVLVPLGTWTGNEIVPLFLDGLSAVLTIFNEIWEAVQPGLQWLWDNFLKPIAEWTGGVIVSVLEGIVDLLQKFGQWCADNQVVIQNIAIVAGSFAAAWLLVNGALTAWNIAIGVWNSLGAIATAVTTGFGAAVAVLTSPVTIVIAAIGALIAVVALLVTHWDEVKGAAEAAWNGIKSAFSSAASWLDKNVIQPIVSGFKSFINGLIGMVEGFVNFFIRGINNIISGLNSLSFTLPDFLGGGTFGLNIPTVSEIKLPRLAQGAVIPPNREFLAVLGDQKQGTNIETPLATMIQAFKQAYREMGMDGGESTIVIEVDGQQFGKAVYKFYNRENKRIGATLVSK